MSSTSSPVAAQQQPTFVEEPANYTFNITLTALQQLQQVAVPIDRDADFLLTGVNGSSTGAYNVNLRLPSLRLLASAIMNNTNFIGTANQPTAIGPPPIYRAGSNGPALDLADTSNASNTIQIIFSGIRRIRTS